MKRQAIATRRTDETRERIGRPASQALDLALIPAGFAVWSAAFIALYGLLGLGCAYRWHELMAGPASLLRLALGGVWIGFILAGAALAFWSHRRLGGDLGQGRSMLRFTAYASALAALAATALTGLPILAVTMCQ